jgi:hypothetical protein
MAAEKSKADMWWASRAKRWLKKQKARLERRKAKKDPESNPTYGKYNGW